ncbi:MAG: type IV secretory system conjugative DNA transfer family protein [Leucobacter sp.]
MNASNREWREVIWPRPFKPEAAVELLERLAVDAELGEVIFEARACGGSVRTFCGVRRGQMRNLTVLLGGSVPGARIIRAKKDTRQHVSKSVRLNLTHPTLALNTERMTAVSRAVLAGLSAVEKDEQLVLQVMLGGRLKPEFVPQRMPETRTPWLDLLVGGVREMSSEQRGSVKARKSLHGFRCTIRVGTESSSEARSRSLISGVVSGLRVAESAGVQLGFQPEPVDKLNDTRRPWRYPLALSTRELAALIAWPLSESAENTLPGHPGTHPRLLPPPERLASTRRPFAVTTAPGEPVRFGISARDSLQHTLLMGPTGSGKSVAMLAQVENAMLDGRGLLLIDPKTDLVNDVLARVPEHRRRDVVVIDPTSSRPIGMNPLQGDGRSAELRADAILAVFRDLFADSWGPRTQDILTASLLLLARQKGATLTMLPALLTDERFRRKMLRGVEDKLGLGTFWAGYEAMSDVQRAQVIAPVMNKIRAFLLRPSLRAVLGQAEPVFQLNDIFTKRRIVLVSLNKGLIGAESARLLGALIVSQLWPLTLARAGLPANRRHVVSVFIDEVQDYLTLPTDLEDALAQARGLGVGFTVAHQYRKQLPPSLRAGLDTNARNKIVFGLNADDARDMAQQAPGLDAQDFMLLPRYGVYATVQYEGHSSGWFSARTLPPSTATSDPVELRVQSEKRYGRDAAEVEREVLEAIGLSDTAHLSPDDSDEVIGRRPSKKERA